MSESIIVGQPLRVPNAKFAIDIVGLAFWVVLGVGLAIGIMTDQSLSKVAFFVVILPLILAGMAIRDIIRHKYASCILIHENGIEIRKKAGSEWFDWKEVKKLTERRKFSGGLTVYNQSGEALFIPFVVDDYNKIRDYIVSKSRNGIQPRHTEHVRR